MPSPDETSIGIELEAELLELDDTSLGSIFDGNAHLPPNDIGLLIDCDDSKVTAPGDLEWDARKESIDRLTEKIEDKISGKWDLYEASRAFELSDYRDFTLGEMKRALAPYYKKGWFITISLPDPQNEDIMLTYHVNADFITNSKLGSRSQDKNIHVRFYAREPETPQYMKGVVDLGKALFISGIAATALSAVALAMFSHPIWAAISIGVLAPVFLVPAIRFTGRYVSLSKHKKAGANGPLLWVDDVQSYKTSNKTRFREDRIEEVVKYRVLSVEGL